MSCYTDKQKKKIYSGVCAKLSMALDNKDFTSDKSIIWKNIFFILDQLNSEEFFGELVIKILGNRMLDIKEQERSFKMDGYYLDFEEELDNC